MRTAPAASLVATHGAEVTLVGEAQNWKLGGALVSETSFVWLDDAERWPSEVVGQQVAVTGVVKVQNDLPVFIHDPADSHPPQGIPLPAGTDLEKASQPPRDQRCQMGTRHTATSLMRRWRLVRRYWI